MKIGEEEEVIEIEPIEEPELLPASQPEEVPEQEPVPA